MESNTSWVRSVPAFLQLLEAAEGAVVLRIETAFVTAEEVE
jgi:hypothetical protein